MITVTDLYKTYPGKVPTHALRGVSFEIPDGEFLLISGRSGSGKSTLLHQLGLLDTPTSGTITIDGVNAGELSDAASTEFRLRNLGYVFQEYALILELTALENVFIPHMAAGGQPDHYKKRAGELLHMVGLQHRLDHYPSELSGGEQQRVAIARSLINDPKVIFADEPTANLDSVSANMVLELFSKLNKDLKQTIVMVSHEPEEVRSYVDRVMWLEDGALEKIEKR